jgi:hypothetical protein
MRGLHLVVASTLAGKRRLQRAMTSSTMQRHATPGGAIVAARYIAHVEANTEQPGSGDRQSIDLPSVDESHGV